MISSGYTDQNLIQNSALACFLLSSFVHQYEELTAKTASPSLMKTLLVLPIVWHKASCKAIYLRKTTTPLHSVLVEVPCVRANFQDRLGAFAQVSCQGLNLACATGLLERKLIKGEPHISAAFSRWPKNSKPTDAPTEMLHAVDRLAFWFKDSHTAELYGELLKG